MIKRLSALLVALFSLLVLHAQQRPSTTQPLRKGMKITSSIRITKSGYFLKATGNEEAILLIEGDNIVIDFNNAELMGSITGQLPDSYTGTAILVRNSKNVVIKNCKARGYKIALRAMDVDHLTLENCNFSYNYRQRLASTPEKEDMADWMSYQQNEKDEWLRYGAGIYLRNCMDAAIQQCTVTGGQNALMMTGCSASLIANNDFSFNSGIGIGMYRCNKNNILYNRVIFNIRGYSHAIYNGGQNSAGILVYEQSSNNLFYKNNVTHGGSGFFLWAGQSTIDNGEGGCNDNIIAENDFSYAATNGVEAGFSRNMIYNNRIFECEHGIWGGYSYSSVIRDNKFRNNAIAIAIEQGQENKIAFNLFYRDKEAIRLWGNEKEPADRGLVKDRDTKSRNYTIVSNSFNGNELAMNFIQTQQLVVFSNSFAGVGEEYRIDTGVAGLDTSFQDGISQALAAEIPLNVPSSVKPNDPFKGSGAWAGRKNILMTEWGPYDFRSPVIWQTNATDTSGLFAFDLLGPKGRWKVKSLRGLKDLSLTKGELPAKLTANKTGGPATDIVLELEYTGAAAIVSPAGVAIPAGKPFSFAFRKFLQPVDWQVLFYSMDTTYYNPLKTGDLFSPTARMAPVRTDTVDKLEYDWPAGLLAGGREYKQFLTIATAKTTLPVGRYTLSVSWADAVRIYVNNKEVLDEWKVFKQGADKPAHRRIALPLNGATEFRVEQLGLGGPATIVVKLERE